MNIWTGIGRLTKDPEVRYAQGATPLCIARYTLAVDRKFKKDGEPSADFLNIVAFGKAAEFTEKYFTKGMKVAVQGRIQTGSYEKDGRKVYTTDIVAENQEFVESKANSQANAQNSNTSKNDGFMDVPESMMEELPFM